MNKKIVCFTGPRPYKLPWGENEEAPACINLKARLYEAILKAFHNGSNHFISGMALGIDTIAAKLVLALKNQFPHASISLEAAIPYRKQSIFWSQEQRKTYNEICRSADKITIISDEYTPFCLMQRNKYMVDAASRVIAVDSGRPGGTAETISYAKKRNKEIIILVP